MYINKMMIASAFLSVDLILLTACSDWVLNTESDMTSIIDLKTEEIEQESRIEESNIEQESHIEESDTEQDLQFGGIEIGETYYYAYQDFLLNTDIDSGSDFPIWGYYLFDMNFDGIPELGVLHDSGGSMGGYFTFYRFDGNAIVPAVLDASEHPVQISNYTQILADYDHRKVYFLKEMYLLVGNDNGTYGYVREVTDKNGILYCSNVLKLEVDCDSSSEMIYEIQHDYEDDFLSDLLADEYLITESYVDGAWKEILPEEYLAKKRELIPRGNSFTDIRHTDAYLLLCDSVYELIGDDGRFHNRRMTEEEIDILFAKWIEGEASEKERISRK
ncbi:MAG: hypothetical protein K2H91_06495 [Lachnospiraceae bacterium]|nr:hypothetical protein [Lachnospiraceae bacterium]